MRGCCICCRNTRSAVRGWTWLSVSTFALRHAEEFISSEQPAWKYTAVVNIRARKLIEYLFTQSSCWFRAELVREQCRRVTGRWKTAMQSLWPLFPLWVDSEIYSTPMIVTFIDFGEVTPNREIYINRYIDRWGREIVAGGALLTSHHHPALLPSLGFAGAITCGGVRDVL